MNIAAGDPDATHSFTLSAGLLGALRSGSALHAPQPLTVYSASLLMHLRGARAMLSLDRASGGQSSLLDIPRWDFHWQASYQFAEPKRVNRDDRLTIECHWDDSADNQPVIAGHVLTPEELNWGEGTTDETCLGFLYATE
jgi:hypothetical protein